MVFTQYAMRPTLASQTKFADDGVIELPWVNARAEGPAAIEKFIAGLLAKVPDFCFQNIRIWIQTPDQVFDEYDVEAPVPSTGRPIDRPTPDASSRRMRRSNSCESRSILWLCHGHSARIERRPWMNTLSRASPRARRTGRVSCCSAHALAPIQ
jgi:hypothetical protein